MTTDLDALALQAGALDAESAASEPGAVIEQQEAAALMDAASENAQQIAMIISLAMPAIGVMYPSLPAVYTPEAVQGVAGTMGPLLAKYGIRLKDLGGRYKEEIAAALVCGPVAVATYRAIGKDVAERAKREPVEAKPASGKIDAKPVEAQRVLPETPVPGMG